MISAQGKVDKSFRSVYGCLSQVGLDQDMHMSSDGPASPHPSRAGIRRRVSLLGNRPLGILPPSIMPVQYYLTRIPPKIGSPLLVGWDDPALASSVRHTHEVRRIFSHTSHIPNVSHCICAEIWFTDTFSGVPYGYIPCTMLRKTLVA